MGGLHNGDTGAAVDDALQMMAQAYPTVLGKENLRETSSARAAARLARAGQQHQQQHQQSAQVATPATMTAAAVQPLAAYATVVAAADTRASRRRKSLPHPPGDGSGVAAAAAVAFSPDRLVNTIYCERSATQKKCSQDHSWNAPLPSLPPSLSPTLPYPSSCFTQLC